MDNILEIHLVKQKILLMLIHIKKLVPLTSVKKFGAQNALFVNQICSKYPIYFFQIANFQWKAKKAMEN